MWGLAPDLCGVGCVAACRACAGSALWGLANVASFFAGLVWRLLTVELCVGQQYRQLFQDATYSQEKSLEDCFFEFEV